MLPVCCKQRKPLEEPSTGGGGYKGTRGPSPITRPP